MSSEDNTTRRDVVLGDILLDRQRLLRSLSLELRTPSPHECRSALVVLHLGRGKSTPARQPEISDADLLATLAFRIGSRMRRRDLLARLSDNQLAILLRDLDGPANAIAITRRFIRASESPVPSGDGLLYPIVSAGITHLPIAPVWPGDVLNQTSHAASEALAQPQKRWIVNTSVPPMPQLLPVAPDAGDDVRWRADITEALESSAFRLHYQPQIDMHSNRLCGLEALIRWQRNDELVMPGEFIPAAERCGMIAPIGDWAIHEACRQFADWRRSGQDYPRIAINLSAQQMRLQTLDTIRHALRDHCVAPHMLDIEVTESSIMSHPDEAAQLMNELVSMGVRLSLDDFGTGYSSFVRLKRWPFGTIKIDYQFVAGVLHDGYDTEMIRAVIAIARKLEVDTIAEGVESAAQRDALAALGCHAWQGYHCTRPLPPDEIASFLHGWHGRH